MLQRRTEHDAEGRTPGKIRRSEEGLPDTARNPSQREAAAMIAIPIRSNALRGFDLGNNSPS